MVVGDLRRLRITAYDDSGAEVVFRVRLVTIADGRLGCSAPEELVGLVDRDPRVQVEGAGTGTAEVLRSGRTFAEVHGRLRWVRRLPIPASREPVVLVRRD
jgi:hypothetical protein